MSTWIAQNIANILVVVVLIAIVTGILWKLISDKRKGKSSCGCGCSSCTMGDLCKKPEKKEK